MIAELSFGFWTSLFNLEYERSLVHKLLKDRKRFFPALSRSKRKRKTLSSRMNGIRNLRNRVFHHEPVWHWSDLVNHHDKILEGIHWINPPLKEYVEHLDRFRDIYRKGPVSYHDSLQKIIKSKGYG